MPPRKRSDEPELYNRIGLLRAERGMTRQQLADQVGVHYQTIGYLERGEYSPSATLALRLATVFGLPMEAVFSLTPFRTLSEQVYGVPAHVTKENR
ncbi:helix-turn-helix domain-containing protein [Modestobacter sp. I12A-02628]|uniref:Helix-turn-helix transcriptional regulator n=1 Tax=Goekera deserti TaxID=2497753 RepID=A0A7K3WEM7_9ACTN|nr:helix-turn-helix transcriptional regulator [Goekera deserti]MPQ98397.1 helix-turn-helix domain-containing protein [Goekera deserti]NDI48224.1 helix-turn-helix domain-containing protein [Goekera deserti]NEL53973.1 helix-turn-helix transcriptional regulator [Goekera deserti]